MANFNSANYGYDVSIANLAKINRQNRKPSLPKMREAEEVFSTPGGIKYVVRKQGGYNYSVIVD